MESKLQCAELRRSYYYSACMVCWKTENVKYCTKCKIASYCCKEHQKMDWPNHKIFCKGLQNIRADFYDDLTTVRLCKAYQMLVKNNGPSCVYEIQMLMLPKICLTCYSNEDLTTCEVCKCVSYCGKHYEEEYNKHKRDCLEFKTAFEIDKFFWELAPFVPEVKVKTKIPEHTLLEDCYKFLQTRNIPSSLDRIIKEYTLSSSQGMIYVLQKLGLIKNRRYIKPTITLHIIVPLFLYNETSKYLIMPHFLKSWLKNLKHIKCVFIINMSFDSSKGGNTEKEYYDEEIYAKQYHEISELTCPDLIWIYNSGLYTDNMTESIRCMFQFKAPICVSSNTQEEMIQNIKYFEWLEVKSEEYVLKNEKNPFYNKRPYRNLQFRLGGSPIIYHDSFLSVIKPT